MTNPVKGTGISRRKALGLLGLAVAGLTYIAPASTVFGQTPAQADKDKGKSKSKAKSKSKPKSKAKNKSKDTVSKDKSVAKG